MKKILFCLPLLGLMACGSSTIVENYIPTTPAEQKAVQDAVNLQVQALPKNLMLAGHDQDWDDLIKEINTQTRYNLCRPTQYEWKSDFILDTVTPTGRWRYKGEVAWRSVPPEVSSK